MLNLLQENEIMSFKELDDKLKEIIGRQFDVQREFKPIDRRLKELEEHIVSAKRSDVNPEILRSWQTEYVKLTAERERLNSEYQKLKVDINSVSRIRSSNVYSILAREWQRAQPKRVKSRCRYDR